MQHAEHINSNKNDDYDILHIDDANICGMDPLRMEISNNPSNKERMGDGVNLMGDDVNLMGDDVNLMGDGVNLMGDGVNLMGDVNIHIYRFKFTNDFNEELYKFAKIHQYDHRKVFKEAWQIWLEENEELVSDEVKRLTELRYDGDIIDKMFKSARYYFRKKHIEKKELKERTEYVSVDKELLSSMDNHIKNGLLTENYKPSDGFDEFCKNYLDLLREQVNYLCNNGINNPVIIKNKIKKTYKNRYFLVVKQYNKKN